MKDKGIAEHFDLSGKVAVVTGGATGIGRAIVFRLAEAGASVVLSDIDLGMARQTAAEVTSRSSRCETVRGDARSLADAEKVIQAAVGAFGDLDILVNSAGIYPYSSMLEISEKLWDTVMDVNLKGMAFYCQAAAREMISKGHGGRIVNLASVTALHPALQMTHYSASKAGVVMLTQGLALELAPHNIAVNAVAPGTIETPGTRVLVDEMRSSERIRRRIMGRVPLGRMGTPDEVALVVLFLASTAASYMTGSLILVDGGFLLS
jgi:NAD(P)-dependent dehydrogenase (short-subunit alcohol dehydrogenase family)